MYHKEAWLSNHRDKSWPQSIYKKAANPEELAAVNNHIQ
jgi:hypothetical protein